MKSFNDLMNEQKNLDEGYMKAFNAFFKAIEPEQPLVCKNCNGEGFVMEYDAPDDGGSKFPCEHCQEIGGYVRE